MSRIGKLPVPIPKGVTLTVADDGATVTVKGPRGQLSRTLPMVEVELGKSAVVVKPAGDTSQHRSCHGLSRALLMNMVTGCATGHRRTLLINGTGYKAEAAGQTLTLTIGFSHPVVYTVPKGISVGIQDRGTRIDLEGNDNELLGQVAANIRAFRPPEPYKGKGIRYATENVRRKAGKAGK